MSQQASFYYHIDADGNYWFPLFPDAATASFVDGDLYGSSNPGAHGHEFDGATWYMPNTEASDDNDFIGSIMGGTPENDSVEQDLINDGGANITSFSFDSGGDGGSSEVPIDNPDNGSGEAPVDPIPGEDDGPSANANLVVNGSFDNQNAWFGNAVNPVNGINQVFVEQAGNVWDVNLSQQVSLTPGADYTLSFQVSGAEGRSIVAGIGMNEDPWLADVETFGLSEVGNQVVLHLTASFEGVGETDPNFGTLFGGDNSRVIFDMGGDVGAVNIDNVSLVSGHVGTAGFFDIEGDFNGGSSDSNENGTEGYFYQLQPGETQGFASQGPAALKSNTSDNQMLIGTAEDDFLYSYAGDNNVLLGIGGEDVFQVRSDSNQAISLNSDDTPEIIAISGVSSHIFSIDSPLGLISFAVAGIGDEIPADPASIQINASVRAPSGELVELSPSDSPEGGSGGQLNNQTFSIGYDLSRPIENGIGFTLATFDFLGKEPLVGRYDLVSMTVNFGDASISQDFEDVFFEIPAEADAFTPSQTYFVNYEAISFTGEPSITSIDGGDTDAGIGAAISSGTGDFTPVFAQDTLILSGQSSKYLVAKFEHEWFQNADVSYGFKNIETGHVIIASEIEVIKFEYGGEVETLTIDDLTLNADFANELNFYSRGGWAPVDFSQLKFVNGGLELPSLEAGVYLGGNMDLTSVTGSDEGEFGDYLIATSSLDFAAGGGDDQFVVRFRPTGLAEEGAGFLYSQAAGGAYGTAVFSLNGMSLDDADWGRNLLQLKGSDIGISVTIEMPDGETVLFQGGPAFNGGQSQKQMYLTAVGGQSPINVVLEQNVHDSPASEADTLYNLVISKYDYSSLEGEYTVKSMTVSKDGVETVVETPTDGIPLSFHEEVDSNELFWVNVSDAAVYPQLAINYDGGGDIDELKLYGSIDDYNINITGNGSGEITHIVSGSTISATNVEEIWIGTGYERSNIMLIDVPKISSVLPTADLLELVPEFANVGDANLDLPLVFWDKPNGDEYVSATLPVAETDDLYLWVAEWRGQNIILGSPKANNTSTLLKLNLADDPIAQNTNFEVDIDFYTSYMTGELRSYEAYSQYIDDPDNAYGLAPLEILTEQPDISNVPEAAQVDIEQLKYIKLTPGSDRYDNILGDEALNIVAGDGDDLIIASYDADYIDGGSGNDTIRSNPGNDVVLGGLGDDVFLKDFVPSYVPTPEAGGRAALLTAVAGPSGISGEGIAYFTFGITDAEGSIANQVIASVNTPFGQIQIAPNPYQPQGSGGIPVVQENIMLRAFVVTGNVEEGVSLGVVVDAVEFDFSTGQQGESVSIPEGNYSVNSANFLLDGAEIASINGLSDIQVPVEGEAYEQIRHYNNTDTTLGFSDNSDNIDGGEHFDIFRTANSKGEFQLYDGDDFAVLVHKTSGETIKLSNIEKIEFSNGEVMLKSGTGQNAPEVPRPDIEYYSESFVTLQGDTVIEYFAEGGAKDDTIIYQGNISGGAGNDILVEDPDENLTPLGDVIKGGKGNDFIDGGQQGISGRGNEDFNVAEFDGPARNFTFESKIYSEDADKAEIDALIVDLGLEGAADYLVDGQSYFIVADKRGEKGQGTDIVANIQAFDFTDDYITLEATTYTSVQSQDVWPNNFFISPGTMPIETGVKVRPAYWNPDEQQSYYDENGRGWDVFEYEFEGGDPNVTYVVFFDGYPDGPVYQLDEAGNYSPAKIEQIVLEGRGSGIANDIIDASTHEDSPTQANLSGAGGNDVLIGTTGNDRLEGNSGNDFIDAKGTSDRDELNFYDIKQSRFDISAMTYSESADKAALDALIVDLGLSHAADYLVDGQQYLIVEDKRGDKGEGTDIVANVEVIYFRDNAISLGVEEYVRTEYFSPWPENFNVSPADTPAATNIQERVQQGGWVEQFNNYGQGSYGWDAYAYDYADGEAGIEYFVLFRRWDENANNGEGYIDGGIYTRNENGQYQAVTKEFVRLDSYGSAYANDVLDASARDDNPTSAYMDGKGGDDVLIGTLGSDELRGGEGDDFIDGRGSVEKVYEWDADRVSYEGKLSQYDLTYYDMSNTADVTALQALVDELGLSLDGYLDTSQGYYLSIADKITGRDGTDIITGADRIQFNDNEIRLTVETREYSEERELQTPWGWMPGADDAVVETITSFIDNWGNERTPWDDSAEWRVYAYDDGDENTDIYVVFNYRGEYEWGVDGWPEALLTRTGSEETGFTYKAATRTITRSEVTGSFLPDVITVETDEANIHSGAGNDTITLAKAGHVRAGLGDDIVYGGSGQNEIYGEGGNDVIVGGANGGGEDRASYMGQEKFFDIYQLRYAGSNMDIKDALGNSIYTVTAQDDGSGILSFAGGNETILTMASGDSFIVVNDLLPAKFGGQGVDLITGVERISFYGGGEYSEIQTGVTFWDDVWNNRTEANGSIFDDVMDFRAGRAISVEAIKARGGNADQIQAQGQLHASNMRGEEGNDVMLGGYGQDFFNPGKGDDFIDGGSASDLAALVATMDAFRSDVTLTDPKTSADGVFDVYRVHNDRDEYWALRDDNTLFKVNYNEQQDTLASPDLSDQNNNDRWSNNDTVQYSGTRLRYEISTVYLELDENGLPVRDLAGGYNVIEAADYANEAGYEQFFRVKDVLPDAAGGVGTDYLRNIEELYFSDGSEQLAVVTDSWTDRYDRNDWSWQPPRDNNGDYDLSGSIETISGYNNMWGGFNQSWNENSQWMVFRYTDANGDPVTEDGVDLFIVWNSENDWGWPERIVTQDGNGGYTEAFYTQARSNIRGTFADDVINDTADITSNDEIFGNEGNDLILAGEGRDRIKGGEGNDVIFGGGQSSRGWDFEGDIAYYGASSSQYIITRNVFVKPTDNVVETDGRGRFIVYSEGEVAGRGIAQGETELALTADNGFVEATIITDTLPSSQGGEGVDILVGVEGLVFGGSSNWLPHVGSYTRSGDSVGGEDGGIFIGLSSTISVNAHQTYDGNPVVNADLFGTSFDDVMGLPASDATLFTNDGIGYFGSQVSNAVFMGDAGNDAYTGGDGVYSMVRYTGSEDDYEITSNSDGSISVKHLVLGEDSTGTDTLNLIDGIEFEGRGNGERSEVRLSITTRTGDYNTNLTGTDFDDVIDARSGISHSTAQNRDNNSYNGPFTEDTPQYRDRFEGGAGNDIMLGGYGGDNFRSDAGDDFIDGGTASDLDAILAAASPVASAQTLVDPADSAEGSFDVYFVLNGHSNGQFGEYWALRGDGTSFRVDADLTDEENPVYSAADLGGQNNSWVSDDRVEYSSGTKARYIIDEVYIKIGDNGQAVRTADGYETIEVAVYDSEAGYEKVTRVADKLPEVAGGTGTDYLKNIDVLQFSDGDERLSPETNNWTDRYDRNDWSWQPPRDENGGFDLSGSIETVSGYTSMWGGVNSPWNENQEWMVFRYTDANGDPVTEDGVDLYIIWNSENDRGWPERIVTQDGNGGYTEAFYTQARSNIRGTFADDVIDDTADITSDDEIFGNEGNDLILAGEGRDRIKGGEGNDVIFGGGQSSRGWDFEGDIAYFASAEAQYRVIRDVFIKPAAENGRPETDSDGRFIVYSADADVVGRGIVRQATSDDLTEANGYYEATIVIDTLADDLGGEGVDVLVGVEGAVFGSSTDWLPHVGSYISSGDSVGSGQTKFIGLQPTTLVETYDGVRLRIKGTDFKDSLVFSANDVFFDDNNRPYKVDEIDMFGLEGSAGDDVFDMRVFAAQVDDPKKVGFSYGLSFGEASASDYLMSRTDDGGIRLEHLAEGAGNTGVDIIYGAGEITFGDQQIQTDFRVNGQEVSLSWMGDDLNADTARFSDIQGNDNYIRAQGGFGNTSNIDAGAGSDTLQVENTPIWQVGITYSNNVWTVTDNMGSGYGSNGTINATNFEAIELGDWNGLNASINIADPDNVTINIDGRNYTVSSYSDAGELLDADGNKILETIVADLDFASTSGNVIGTDNNDEFLPAPGNQLIFAGSGSNDLASFPYGKFQRYSVNFEYDEDSDGDGAFDNTGVAVSGNASYVSSDGTEFVKYLKLEDGLSSALGGTGTDLLFGFERIYFNGMNRDLVPQAYDGSSLWFNFKSMVENEIVFVSDETISGMIEAAGGDTNQRADLRYEVSFGDVVIGSNAQSDQLNEYVNLMGVQADAVGVVSNTISSNELASRDLNSDGVINIEDSLIANVLSDRNANSSSINQLILSDKDGGKDDLVIFGVNSVRIGNVDFNLTVTTNRDSDGKIWDVRGTELSDTLIGDDTENNFYSGAGTDFIDGIANVVIEDQYWTPRDYLRFEGVNYERAEFNAVQVVVNADGTPGLDADKKIQIVGYTGEAAIDNADISFAASAEAVTLGDGQELVAASMISDRFAASDDSYFGVKIVRNIDGVGFDDRWLDLSVYENVREDTYGANNTPYNQRDLWGTILDDVMLGDGSLDGGARDRLEGRDGNDRLKGGAWGDELIGGLGDDIIDGGADGVSGDVWRDLDVARYNDNALVRYTITKVYVAADFDAASDTPVIYDPSGTIESAGIFTLNQDAAAYEAAKDSLKAAYLVVDALGAELGGTGHDLVIDVERLQFADNENVDLGLRIERNDWDSNRAGYERVSISGTNEADDMRDYGNGIDFDGDGNSDDDLIARKEIDGRDGDDIIFAYGGGSRIIGGTGSDFIDGGADGTSGNSWDDEDRAVFSGKSSRYSLEGTTKLDPVLQNLAQSLGVDLDAYADDQEFTLVRDEATENGDVDVLVNIERIEFSDRDFSIKPSIWIERDADGNELRRNIEGSIKSDVLVGGQFNDWIQGRQGDDVIFAGDGGDDINPGAGTDYIDGGANNNYSDDIYWNPTDTVRIDSSFDNFEVAKAQILVSTNTGQPIVSAAGKWTIIGYSGEAALLSEKISFVDSADGLTSDTVSAVDIYMISDNRAPSDNAYKGVNIVRNVENLSFNDKWVQIEVEEYTNEYTDWRGDTIRESRRNGTVFSEAIIGGLGMDFIEGREGDDYLFGGADGDRLNGGRGNDILWGGADGNSGDSWRDLDVAEYWNESRERFQIYKVKVDTAQFDNFSAGQTTTIIDAFNVLEEGASYEGYTIADSSDAELSDAYLVVDFLPAALGGAGNDLLIDIEQINFEGETIDLGLRIWADDWNQDDVLDWVRVEGTGEDDDIRAWGDEARLNADSEILGKAGNDILFGYAGGDRLAGGTGNDFIDGGADGIMRYGWTPKDEAFFNGVEANYIITNHAYGDPALTELAEELGYADLLATYAPADGEAAPNFTVVRDTKPAQLGGSGTDILVNVEFIGLQDNYLPLAVEKNADTRADFDSDGDGLYDVTGESVDDPNATAEYTVYWVSGTSGSDQISGGIGDDYLSGNAGDDTLVGDRGADYFEPGAGDDYIDGGDNGVFEWNREDVVRFSGDFADYDIGSDFDDDGRLEVIVTDLREEGDGVNRLVNIERIDFNDQSLSIGVSERIMYLRGDLINGVEIQGSAFDDVIEGSYPTDGNASNLRELGNDYLSGEEGDDILYGYAGQDVFVGGLGNDKIYGGENGVDEFGNEGGDTVIYFQDYANYTIEYKTADGLDADSFVSGGYIVVTDNSDDEFSDGTDEIYGVERIVFADTELTFETKIQSVDADGDGIADIASVTGTMQDDVLFGTELDEIFNGQGGNDVIFGRVGNDLFEDSGTDGEDLYVGGGGEDRLSVALAADAYNVAQTFIGFDEEGQVLRDEAADIVFFDTAESVTAGATAKAAVKLTNSSNGQVDVVSGVEYVDFNGDLTALSISVGRAKFANDGSLSQIDVFGTLGDDTISADALAASGNFGADEAAAIMAADNFIFGGRGVDVIDAGAGNDQIILDTTTAANGTSDTVIGGDGIDRVDLSGDLADWTFGTVDVDGVTYDTATNGNQSIRMSGVEAVSFDDEILNLVVTSIEIDRNADGEADGYQIGGTLNEDTLISNEGDLRDILKGGAGDDIVVGQAGDDVIIEGAGNDMIVGGAGFDTVSYNNAAADTTITAGGYVLRNSTNNELVSGFTSAFVGEVQVVKPRYVKDRQINASSEPQVYAVVEDSYLANVASDFDADNDADTVDVVHIDTNRDGEADSYFADLNNDGTADQFAQGSDTDGFDAASMTLRQITLAYEQANGSAKLFYEDVVSEKVFSATTGSETDILIGVELIEFADQALDLQPSATDQSSFSAATGIVQTREIEGTGFADVIDVEALDEVLTLGGGNDIVRLGSDSGSDMIVDFDVKSDVSTNYASVESDFDPDNDADTADKVAVDIDGDGQTDGTFADLDNDGVVDRFDAGADDANFDPTAMTLQAIEIIDDFFDVIEVEKLLNGTSITSFESLRSRMSDTNQGVQISLGVNEAGEEQQITLEGVTVDELSASNFAFVDVL